MHQKEKSINGILTMFINLKSSINESKTTSDKGTYTFHIVNPFTGKTINIIEDRNQSPISLDLPLNNVKKRNSYFSIVIPLSITLDTEL